MRLSQAYMRLRVMYGHVLSAQCCLTFLWGDASKCVPCSTQRRAPSNCFWDSLSICTTHRTAMSPRAALLALGKQFEAPAQVSRLQPGAQQA